MIFGVTDTALLLAWFGAVLGDMVFLTTVAACSLLAIWTLSSHVILRATVAASLFLTIGTVFGNVILFITDLASTPSLLTLLLAVTNTMTLFSAQVAKNLGLLSWYLLLWTSLALVTNFSAVVALVHTTIKWGTGVGKTSEVLFGRGWPFVEQSGTLRLVREKVANSILLAGFTL